MAFEQFRFYSLILKKVSEERVSMFRMSFSKFFDSNWRTFRGGETGVWEYSEEAIMLV